MKTRAICYLCASFALSSEWAQAGDDALRNEKPHVAQVVTLARVAPRLCPGIAADDGAIRVLMGKAGIADEDVQASGAFEEEDTAVANSFAQSVGSDHDGACSEIFEILGPNGGGLLRRMEIKPMT